MYVYIFNYKTIYDTFQPNAATEVRLGHAVLFNTIMVLEINDIDPKKKIMVLTKRDNNSNGKFLKLQNHQQIEMFSHRKYCMYFNKNITFELLDTM